MDRTSRRALLAPARPFEQTSSRFVLAGCKLQVQVLALEVKHRFVVPIGCHPTVTAYNGKRFGGQPQQEAVGEKKKHRELGVLWVFIVIEGVKAEHHLCDFLVPDPKFGPRNEFPALLHSFLGSPKLRSQEHSRWSTHYHACGFDVVEVVPKSARASEESAPRQKVWDTRREGAAISVETLFKERHPASGPTNQERDRFRRSTNYSLQVRMRLEGISLLLRLDLCLCRQRADRLGAQHR